MKSYEKYMTDSRYTYHVLECVNNKILIRDDGYRWSFIPMPLNPTSGLGLEHDEWIHLFEYKHCVYPGFAQEIISQLLEKATQEVECECPGLDLTGDSYQIAGRGLVVVATLKTDTDRDRLKLLIGTEIMWDEERHEITGVESFAIWDQKVGRNIGLLIKKL